MVDQPSTSPHVLTYIRAGIPLRYHEHLAIIEQGGDAVAPGVEFVSEGLRRGHHCCCLAPATLRAGMLKRLGELGVSVERHLRSRALQFPKAAQGASEWLDRTRRFFTEAETAGAPAVRWLEEGVGAKPSGISIPQFFELHSRLNYLVKQYPSAALCRYDTEQLGVPHLFSAIAVHRHLLVQDTLVRDNPFYIPPEKFSALSPEDRERDLRAIFQEVGSDLGKLFSTLAGYGRLQRSVSS